MCTILQDKGRMTLKEIQKSSRLPSHFQRDTHCLHFSRRPNSGCLELWGAYTELSGAFRMPAHLAEPQRGSCWIWKAESWTHKDYSYKSKQNKKMEAFWVCLKILRVRSMLLREKINTFCIVFTQKPSCRNQNKSRRKTRFLAFLF